MPRPQSTFSASQRLKPARPREPSADDDDDDDDSEVERRTKPRMSGAVKLERATATSRKPPTRARDEGSDDENEDDDADDQEGEEDMAARYAGWSVHDYEPRPLTKDHEGVITKTISELSFIANEITKHMMKAMHVAVALEEIQKDAPEVEEIERGYLKCLEQKAILELRRTALEEIKRRLASGAEVPDPLILYASKAGEYEEEYRAQTVRQKFKDDEDYKLFRVGVWHAPFSYVPVQLEFECQLSRKAGDEDEEEDEDDDIRIAGHTQNFIDPISIQPIKDAVVTPCGHHFSRDTIMGMLEQHKGRKKSTSNVSMKCPRADCHQQVSQHDIRADPAFQRRADAHYERETQRRERVEASDEDVVDVNEDEDDYDEEDA